MGYGRRYDPAPTHRIRPALHRAGRVLEATGGSGEPEAGAAIGTQRMDGCVEGMNGKDSVMFSKKSDEWETPKWLFDKLDAEFHFDCDAAATGKNHLCEFYLGEDYAGIPEDSTKLDWLNTSFQNGLQQYYCKVFFLNPPYSKIGAFIKKAYEESLNGAIVVCLIPCRTDTRYWHNYVMKAHEIRLIQGRLKFENRAFPSWTPDGNHKVSPAPFPSCVVVFDHIKYDKNSDPIFKTLSIHKTT